MRSTALTAQHLAPLPARYELAINIGTFNVAAVGQTAIVGINFTTITAVNAWVVITGVAF
ncbi:MAG TPA: hypothetical protein VIO14_13650 [Dehalococcoidia bacterium]